MKILKISHVGIAVSNITKSCKFWETSLGLQSSGSEVVEDQKVKVDFHPAGESQIELLEPTEADSPVAKYLEHKGEGIHHLAFQVENIETALKELKQNNIKLIDKHPRMGAHNTKIAFVHPISTNGVLVELCEKSSE